MKKIFLIIFPFFISAFLLAHPDEPTPSKSSNVVWHSITVVDYKPGTVETAREIIQKYESASEKAGTPSPVIYWFESGKYDMVVTWELKNGPDDLNESWSPADESWWAALVSQEGSEEAARQLHASYQDLIDSSITNVACKAK
jgi:hypothetical protein